MQVYPLGKEVGASFRLALLEPEFYERLKYAWDNSQEVMAAWNTRYAEVTVNRIAEYHEERGIIAHVYIRVAVHLGMRMRRNSLLNRMLTRIADEENKSVDSFLKSRGVLCPAQFKATLIYIFAKHASQFGVDANEPESIASYDETELSFPRLLTYIETLETAAHIKASANLSCIRSLILNLITDYANEVMEEG